MVTVRICEIFSSLNGEGKYTGHPTTFIRLSGCPFNCSYCDTLYAKNSGKKMSIDKIMTEVNKLGNKYVCITGGEPLVQNDTMSLVYELLSFSYIVSIETSGLVEIEEDGYARTFNYTMDIKCPSSGVSDSNVYANLSRLKSYDEVKFVIVDSQDLEFAKTVLKKYPTKAQVIYSPVNNNLDVAKMITESLINKGIQGKLGLQLHKILNIK